MKLPGPPGTSFDIPVGDDPAVGRHPRPRPWAIRSTVVRPTSSPLLAADSSFSNVDLDHISDTSMQVKMPCVLPAVCNGINIVDGGADDLVDGQLIMLTKGSISTLVQITTPERPDRELRQRRLPGFNQSAAVAGSLRGAEPVGPFAGDIGVAARDQTQASRIRMITYYIDAHHRPGAAGAGPPHEQRPSDGVQQQSRARSSRSTSRTCRLPTTSPTARPIRRTCG